MRKLAEPAILMARFGPQGVKSEAFVRFTAEDQLKDLVVIAATCMDLPDFFTQCVALQHRRKCRSRD